MVTVCNVCTSFSAAGALTPSVGFATITCVTYCETAPKYSHIAHAGLISDPVEGILPQLQRPPHLG